MKSKSSIHRNPSGQSFVELALVFVILIIILGSVVEYGFLLNEYLNTLDAAREAARDTSDIVPFVTDLTTGNIDYSQPDIPGFYEYGAAIAMSIMQPLQLDPTSDEIIISVFSISNGNATRFPCNLVGASDPVHCPNYPSDDDGWHFYGSNNPNSSPPSPYTSRYTNADLEARLLSTQDTGLLLVEIFYNYHQILKLPYLAPLGDPVTLRSDAFMPLTSAEPTPGP